MNDGRKSLLARLDDSVRWTGMPERVAAQMSGDPDRKHGPLRWRPIGPIAYALLLFGIALAWPWFLDGFGPGALAVVIAGSWGWLLGMAVGIHAKGPLGSSSLDDDERQAALRKESFLFCLGILAVLNVLGQPVLMFLLQWQDWTVWRTAIVVATGLMLNVALWGSLPTLYASWKLRDLSRE